jgi:hypothetical protein
MEAPTIEEAALERRMRGIERLSAPVSSAGSGAGKRTSESIQGGATRVSFPEACT